MPLLKSIINELYFGFVLKANVICFYPWALSAGNSNNNLKSTYYLLAFISVSLARVSEIFPPLFRSILVTSSAVIYNLWLRAQSSISESYKGCHNRLAVDDCSTNICIPKREKKSSCFFFFLFNSDSLSWFREHSFTNLTHSSLTHCYADSWYCCFVP